MSPDTSVVVVSHRPGAWLAECLASVLPQADEVVCVDNGADGEAAAVAGDLGAAVVHSPVNVGFTGGVALGLARARGAVVGVLNDDAVAGPGWLAAAGAVLEDPTVAAVTPKVVLSATYAELVLDDDPWYAPGDARPLGRRLATLTVDGADVLEAALGAGLHDLEHAPGAEPARWRWTAGRLPFYVPLPATHLEAEVRVDGEVLRPRTRCRLLNHAGSFLEFHGVAGEYGLGAPDDGRFDSPAERFGFSATAPVFRAETLRRLGGFAVPFFAYNEDTDWCLRARLAGLRVLYDPAATVHHRLSATSQGSRSARVRFLARRNAALCLVRNAPTPVALRQVRLLLDGAEPALRRAVLDKLPWAWASRQALRRQWRTTPRRVWTRWAGAGTTWDTSPARLGG